MSDQCCIDLADEDDLSAVAALHGVSFKTAWTAQEFASLLNAAGTTLLVARLEQTIAGFLLIRAVSDEAEIITIAVDPAYRRQRIGRDLLEAISAQGPELQRLFLEVAEADDGACGFYKAFGFQPCGRRVAYYADRPAGENDALIMRYDIPR